MKETVGIAGLWIPGEKTREWWKPDRNGVWQKSGQGPSSGQPSGFSFSAFACHSYPLWISSDDPEIIDQIVPMELEQIGAIAPGDLETHRDLRRIDQDGSRTLVQALVIPGQLEDEPPSTRWHRFFPSPCLYAFPRNRIVIWKELGRFVVAFTREGRLVHFHAFGRGSFSEDLVAEIACIYGELYGRDVVDEVTSLLAWTEDASTPEARVMIDRSLQLPVEQAEKPPPDPAIAATIELVPDAVLIARERQRQRSRLVRAAVLVCCALLAAAGLAAFSLYRAENYNRDLREKIASFGPAASSIRDARARWDALSPAVAVNRNPVEIFHQIASLLPPKGIQVTHFEIDGNRITLRGEASTLAKAVKLKADLEKSRELADYQWTQPQPDLTGDTAKFQAIGDYRFDVSDEG